LGDMSNLVSLSWCL